MGERSNGLKMSSVDASFLLTMVIFGLYWTWQTSLLYMPLPGSDENPSSSIWYVYNAICCLGYVVLAFFSARIQSIVESPVLHWAASGCVVVATVAALSGLSSFVLTVFLLYVPIAIGGALFTACRFDLLCKFDARRRLFVLLFATVAQMLLFVFIGSLPKHALFAALVLIPVALPPLFAKAYRPLHSSEAIQAEEGEKGRLPFLKIAAFALIAFSMNLIRSEIDSGSAYSALSPDGVMALAGGIVAVCVAAIVLAKSRLNFNLAPLVVVLLATLAVFLLLIGLSSRLLSSALSAAAFYLFVAMFWDYTAAWCCSSSSSTVWMTAVTHIPYDIGFLAGTLVFRAVSEQGLAGGVIPLLFASYASLVGAFFFFEHAEKREAVRLRSIEPRPVGSGRLEAAVFDVCLEAASIYSLTQREYETLRLIAVGKRLKAVAEEQGVSENTVKSHVSHIYSKLGVHSREELMSLMCSIDSASLGAGVDADREV